MCGGGVRIRALGGEECVRLFAGAHLTLFLFLLKFVCGAEDYFSGHARMAATTPRPPEAPPFFFWPHRRCHGRATFWDRGVDISSVWLATSLRFAG